MAQLLVKGAIALFLLSATSLAAHKEHGLRLSTEWSGCSIYPFGTDTAQQQLSLRKKIKEQRDTSSQIKATEIQETHRAEPAKCSEQPIKLVNMGRHLQICHLRELV